MICESCKFDNREGALFCAECGKPLTSASENAEKPVEKDSNKTVILDEVVTNSKESVDKEDDSEANTTVLTSDMLKPAQATVTPQGFTAGPASTPVKPMAPQGAPMSPQPMAPQAPKMAAPQGMPMNPQAPQAPKMAAPQGMPMNPQAPQAPQMAAPQGAPMNAQAPQAPQMAAPQGAPMNPQAPQAPKMAAPASTPAPAPAKADKKSDKKASKKEAKAAKKAAKGKMGTGTKVYIVISIILMLAMAGAIVYGYFYHTDKMDTAKTEKENLIADYDSQLSQKDNEIANLYASSTDAQSTITSLESQLADNELALAEAQAAVAGYVAYDPLIQFVESSTGDASTDMMVSDTVIYTTVGSTVDLYVYFPSQEGELSYTATNADIVNCEWGEEWVNGNVVPVTIEAVAAGDATIEITNDQNDISEVVFIHIQ